MLMSILIISLIILIYQQQTVISGANEEINPARSLRSTLTQSTEPSNDQLQSLPEYALSHLTNTIINAVVGVLTFINPDVLGKVIGFETESVKVGVQTRDKTLARITLNARVVTPFNKHLLPSVDDCGFEFYSLSESKLIETNQFTERECLEMVQEMADNDQLREGLTLSLRNPILNAIVKQFQHRNLIGVRIQGYQVREVGAETELHFDTQNTGYRLWIPLHTIDNLCLGVGDVRKLDNQFHAIPLYSEINNLHTKSESDAAVYYQQCSKKTIMTPKDWIFFQANAVPHYSANSRESGMTKHRRALIVNLEFGSLLEDE